MKKYAQIILMLLLLLLSFTLLSCSFIESEQSPLNLSEKITPGIAEKTPTKSLNTTTAVEAAAEQQPLWLTKDIVTITGETISIAQFEGKPVLVESFAVWCPLCTQQQKIFQELHKEVGDKFISISIDTDPNEDASLVQEHIQQNGFTWSYVIAPTDFTQSLIDSFGTTVITAPSVPVILICSDQSYTLLPRGVKSKETLLSEITTRCSS